MDPLIKVNVDLKGLSSVAIKLGEIVSEAVGGLCRPWQIKRVGSAEAEVDRLKSLTQAKTTIEVTDLQRRALERFVGEEAQRQANMEAITGKALLQVSEKARPEDVSKDWIVHFFDRCRLTSDEEMQKLWAKVLAGEAEQPTTFSKRTLDVIGTLEKFDAQNFEMLCRFLWRLRHLPSPILYGFDMNSLRATGLSFGRIQHLSELGLVSIRDGLAFTQHWDTSPQIVSYFSRHVEVTLPKGQAAMNVGLVMLTRVGFDLASICTVQPVDGYFDEVVNLWRNTYHYTVKEVPPPISQSGTIGSRDDISTKPPEAALPVWG